MVERARPSERIYYGIWLQFSERTRGSFSGLFFAFGYTFAAEKLKNKYWRELFGTLSILTFLAVGFSRVYLNVHWLSDVIAGFSLGIFWLTLVMLSFRFLNLGGRPFRKINKCSVLVELTLFCFMHSTVITYYLTIKVWLNLIFH